MGTLRVKVGKDPSKDHIVGDLVGLRCVQHNSLHPGGSCPSMKLSSERLFSVCEMVLIAVSSIKGLKRSQVGKGFENEQERGILKVNGE